MKAQHGVTYIKLLVFAAAVAILVTVAAPNLAALIRAYPAPAGGDTLPDRSGIRTPYHLNGMTRLATPRSPAVRDSLRNTRHLHRYVAHFAHMQVIERQNLFQKTTLIVKSQPLVGFFLT